MVESNDKILFIKITDGDEQAFEEIFHRYYQNLCVYASKFTQNDEDAEEIVQDLFVNLWEKRNTLEVKISVKNYLARSVKNHCLNFIKHNNVKNIHTKKVLSDFKNNPVSEANFIEVDLMKKIEESINSLPDKRKEVFRLSREEGLKYREIAEKLNISIKTVEAQMGLAIKTLREKLKDYKAIFPFFYIFFNGN